MFGKSKEKKTDKARLHELEMFADGPAHGQTFSDKTMLWNPVNS